MPAEIKAKLQNGFFMVANDLAVALARVNLSAYESRVLWGILRICYGYNTNKSKITPRYLSSIVGIRGEHVCHALKKLKEKGIIAQIGSVVEIQNVLSLWSKTAQIGSDKTLPKSAALPKQAVSTAQIGSKTLLKQAPPSNKYNINTTIKNNSITSSPSAKKRPEIGKEIKIPRKQIAYPKEIIQDITAYYVNRKGIRPQGDEWLPILQAVKTMLMNGRTPQDIKDCVYWMSTHWGSWDIHTVAKRMPEFLAGALERKKLNPILADVLFKRLIGYDSSTDAGYRAELATENALEAKYPGWKFAEEWREARMFLQNARKKGGAEENQLLATHPMIVNFRQKFLELHAVN